MHGRWGERDGIVRGSDASADAWCRTDASADAWRGADASADAWR